MHLLRPAKSDGHFQCPDRQVTLHPIADSPSDDEFEQSYSSPAARRILYIPSAEVAFIYVPVAAMP